MNMKKLAVARVQAIQVIPKGRDHHLAENMTTSSMAGVLSRLNAAEGKALGDIVAHEVDNDCTRDDRQRACSRQQSQFVT